MTSIEDDLLLDERGEFYLDYQPQFTCSGDRLVGVEARSGGATPSSEQFSHRFHLAFRLSEHLLL